MTLDNTFQIAYASGYNAAKERAAEKVKEAFNELPPSADARTKDILLDLYNEIREVPAIADDGRGSL